MIVWIVEEKDSDTDWSVVSVHATKASADAAQVRLCELFADDVAEPKWRSTEWQVQP